MEWEWEWCGVVRGDLVVRPKSSKVQVRDSDDQRTWGGTGHARKEPAGPPSESHEGCAFCMAGGCYSGSPDFIDVRILKQKGLPAVK